MINKPKPEAKPAVKPKPDVVALVTPDGREYRTSRAEADRLVRTAGYTRK